MPAATQNSLCNDDKVVVVVVKIFTALGCFVRHSGYSNRSLGITSTNKVVIFQNSLINISKLEIPV